MSLSPVLPLVQSLELDPSLPLETDAELEKVAPDRFDESVLLVQSLALRQEMLKRACCSTRGDDPPKGLQSSDMMMSLESCSSGALQVRGDDPPKGLQSSVM